MNERDWYWLARERSRELAFELVRLELLARDFERAGRFDKAGEVLWDRESVQAERSMLMREIWEKRSVFSTP